MSIGKLIVELVASTATFQGDLGKAAAVAEQQARRIDKAVGNIGGSIKAAFAGLAGGLSIAALAGWTKDVIASAEQIHNLAIETGSTVESLSRLQNIAIVSGKDFGTFQLAISRLAAGLAGSEEGSSKTAQALQFLGITAKDPATALQDVADKLEKYSDGASKAAIARDLFGRGGVQFVSVLHEMATAQGVTATTMAEQATKAAELAQELRKLQVESTTLKNLVLIDLVPALAHLVEDFNEGRKAAGGFFEAMRLYGLGINPFKDINTNLADVRKQIEELQSSTPNEDVLQKFGFHPKSADRLRDLGKQLEFLKMQQRQSLGLIDNPANYDARDIRARQRPDLGYVSGAPGAGKIEDIAKKLLEGDIKAIDASIEEEKTLLGTRNEVLAKYYEQGYLSIADYYERTGTLRQDNLAQTIAGYNQELAETDAFINARDGKTGKLLHSEADRQDVKNKSIEIEKKLALAQQESAKQGVLGSLDQAKATEAYAQSVRGLTADVLDLQGKTAEAAKIRIAAQADSDRGRFRTDPAAVAEINAKQRLLDLQADLNASALKFGQVVQATGIADSIVDLKLQTGRITEIDALNEKTALHEAFIPILEREAAAYEALAKKTTNPAYALAAAELRLQIAQLAAQSDALAGKFRDIFEGSATTFFTDLISGTKTVKQAFLDMGKSIEQSISQIAAKNLAQSLFGAEGPLGGLSTGLASLFGGGKGTDATGAVALAGSAATLTASGGVLAAAGASLIAAAGALGASSVASAFGKGSAPLGDVLSMLGDVPFFAGGTDYAPGGLAIVGEKGKELVNLPRGAQVIPNHVFQAARSAKTTIHAPNITINVPAGTSRASADQIAMETGRAVQRAMGRIG